MTVLTSLDNPLKIATVGLPHSQGAIGITLCPGKHQRDALSGHFQRDLQLDLDFIKSWGASAVVSLISNDELASFQVARLGTEVEARDMLWFHLPLIDHALPGEVFERQWVYTGLRLRTLLRKGHRILIHCSNGLGRSGLIAARLLTELAMPAEQAIAAIRHARPGCLESTIHKQYLSLIRVMNNDTWFDRALGCLIGGAVGDAWGYAVEFDSLENIRQRFGPDGLTKPISHQGKLVVSDDTQMTLFTLEGILRCTNERGEIVAPSLSEEIRHAYLDWYDTQSGRPAHPRPLYGWLATRSALRVRRAPGNSCLSALQAGGKGRIEAPCNNSKGCGGVMRTAPVGFLQNIDSFTLGAQAAALTHGHVDGWAPAGLLPRIVAQLIKGEDALQVVSHSFSDAGKWKHISGRAASTAPYSQAIALAQEMRFNPCEAIRQLGQGWVGEEALAIGIYAFLSARDFRDALSRATNHDGDSDSTAAIAGQLWGAKRGLSDIPHEWVRRLDVFDELLALAQRMQSWDRQVADASPDIDDTTLACIRLIEMTHELHAMGYQKIRIFPSFAPSGCHWRVQWVPDSAFDSALELAQTPEEPESARYSSGAGWQPFNWRGVRELSAKEMAEQFVRQYPALARAGAGDDWAYAGWFTRLLGEARNGHLPYFVADWETPSHVVPMSRGGSLPLPPPPGRIHSAYR